MTSLLRALALLAFTALSSLRADEVAPATPPITDPALIAEHYHQVASRPEFTDSKETGVDPRLQDLLSEWFQNLGKRIGDFKYANRMPAFESLLMTLLVVLSVAILIYIIFRLTRRRALSWDDDKPAPPGELKLHAPEFYEEEISRAVAAHDWHAAWLAAWRQFLSRLERRSLVEADRTRTNREYLSQLRGQPLPATALALLVAMVDAYDRSIYGHAAIGEAEWNQFHHQIEEAALLLHLDDRRPLAPATGAAT